MHKQFLILAAKYGFGIGVLALVVWWQWERTSPEGQEIGISRALGQPVHLLPLLVAGLVCLVCVLLTFVRWFLLVRAQELPFTLGSALRLGLVGFYFNTFLSGAVGGDIIKAAFIAREQSRRTVAVATVLLDRAVGLCGLFWLAALLGGLFWATGQLEVLVPGAAAVTILESVVLGSVGIAGGSLVFWIILGFLSSERAGKIAHRLETFPKIGHSLAEFWRAVWMYRCKGRAIALTLALSMFSHAGFILTFYFAALTLSDFNQVPSLGTHFLLVPVAAVVQAGFPAPGGMGGGELAYSTLYQLMGFPSAAGVLGSLVQRCINWTWGLVGYMVYLGIRPGLARKQEQLGRQEPVLVLNCGPSTDKN